MHAGEQRSAAALGEAAALQDELQDFQRKVSDAGRATYNASNGAHDDLVLACTIAVWFATNSGSSSQEPLGRRFEMKPARPITGYFSETFHPPFNRSLLACSAPVLGELIGSLELFSEVKSFGKDLLKMNGHQQLGEAFVKFQAYIRQARTFFEGAEVLHHRASPLNYYYAFMNFAKAYIFLRTPGFVDNKLVHGLFYRAQSGGLRKQSVHVDTKGVFPLLYRQVTGAAFSASSKMKVADLLGYVTDVSYEFAKLKYGKDPLYRCRFAIGVNQQTNIAFPILAFQPGGRDPSKANFHLEKHFEQIAVDRPLISAIFGLKGEELSRYQFFEGKELGYNDIAKLAPRVASDLAGVLSYNPVDDPFLFLLNEKIRSPKLAPMQELLAIYCCMFYLGSLVRYRPDLLEAMLLTKDAWIIERFTRSAPLAFLRHFRNLIDGQYLVFHAR